MFKKLTLFTALLVFCLMASNAFAVQMSFPKFTLDAPAGWLLSEEGPVVKLSPPEGGAAISFTVSPLVGMPLGDFAAAASKAYNGTTPEFEDDTYFFTFEFDGLESTVSLWQNGEDYVMIILSGDHDQFDAIFDSFELND